MNKGLAAALIAAVIVGSGCGANSARNAKAATQRNPAPCPNVVVLSDAARVIEFDGEERIEDVAFTGEIANVDLQCRYFRDKPIDATVKIDFAFGKGPKAGDNKRTYTYFVAVTRKDLEVIEKVEFQIPVRFGSSDVVQMRDNIDKIVIPRAAESTSGANFEVIVGFSVTPKQAVFNRSGRSLKFPDMKK